jgi:diguanylate cyclase (GGDEF)-like protein
MLATRVLLVGFPAAERRGHAALLDEAPTPFLVRAATTIDEVRAQTEQGAFDIALLNLGPSEVSGASQLARAATATHGVPLLALVEGARSELGALGVYDVVSKRELDAASLAREIERCIARRRAADALAPEKEGFATSRDAATGLLSEMSVNEHLERILHHAERNREQVAVLLLELDRIEAFGRRLGRDVADSLLITAADRLRGALRKSDVIAHLGDGTFVALLQGRDLDYAPARAAERMLECLTRSFVVDGDEHDMSASVGVSLYPRDAKEGAALLRHASFARDTAHAAGRNCYRFYGHTESASEARRHVIGGRIRGALERGDLRLHYQPRVDAQSGSIVGVEALLRWHDEKLGVVSPAEFVPIAERSGQMDEIGSWVMREACEAHRRWREAGFGQLRLSVNVSAHQVQSTSLRDAVVDAVMETSLPPSVLEVELTETALVDNQNTAAKLFRELAEIGVTLSLDDFGTGHSALSYVRTFPVRILKIDPSFVREITPEAGCPRFVNGILALARALGLEVVAEGVETELQRDALLAGGCREMQGFLFSPGVPEDALLALLHAGTLPAAAAD